MPLTASDLTQISDLITARLVAARIKISELPAAGSIARDAVFPVVSDGATIKWSVAQMLSFGVTTVAVGQDLRAMDSATIADNALFYTEGVGAVGDGGGGFWYYDADSVAADNIGTVIQPDTGVGRFLRLFSGYVDPRWFELTAGLGSRALNKIVMSRVYGYAAANPGTTILFPPGAWYIEPNATVTEMNVPSDTTILGSSGTTIFLTYGATEPATSGSFSTVDIFRMDGVSDIRISGFKIVGSLTPSWFINSASIPIYDCTNITLENLVLTQSQVDGLYINTGLNSNIKVVNVFIEDSQRSACSITKGSGMQFVNCNFNASTTQDPWSGVNIETESATVTVADVQFNNCVFNGNLDSPNGAGLYIHRGNQPQDPTRIQVNACLFNGNGFGVRLDRVSYVKISGDCIFRNQVSADISFTRASYCESNGSDMQGAGRGVYLINSSQCKITGGSIKSATANAIEFIDNDADATFANLNNTIEGVTIHVCGEIGIKIAGSSHTVRDCKVSECQEQGIVEATLGANNKIDGNFCFENGLATDNTYSAIQTNGANTVVTNNVVRKCFMSQGGTAQSGAAGSITLSPAAPIRDDVLNGLRVYIISGTGSGQIKFIDDYNGTTKVATVTVNFSPAPDNTSVYEIIPAGATQGYGILIDGSRNFVSDNDCLYAGATSNLLSNDSETTLRDNRTVVGPSNDATGSWTAAFANSGGGGTININSSYDTGWYEKKGDLVVGGGYFLVGSITSSPTGIVTLTGLPFACRAGDENMVAVTIRGNGLAAGATTALQGYIAPGSSVITLGRYAAGDNNDISTLLQASSDIRVQFAYRT